MHPVPATKYNDDSRWLANNIGKHKVLQKSPLSLCRVNRPHIDGVEVGDAMPATAMPPSAAAMKHVASSLFPFWSSRHSDHAATPAMAI